MGMGRAAEGIEILNSPPLPAAMDCRRNADLSTVAEQLKREAEEVRIGNVVSEPPEELRPAKRLPASNLGRDARIFDDSEVIQLLRAAVEREGNQGAFAKRHGLGRTYLNQILNGKKGPSRTILDVLGLRKVYAPK
jgi:hypothetical protein